MKNKNEIKLDYDGFIKQYKSLNRGRNFIGTIEPSYFFAVTDMLLNRIRKLEQTVGVNSNNLSKGEKMLQDLGYVLKEQDDIIFDRFLEVWKDGDRNKKISFNYYNGYILFEDEDGSGFSIYEMDAIKERLSELQELRQQEGDDE